MNLPNYLKSSTRSFQLLKDKLATNVSVTDLAEFVLNLIVFQKEQTGRIPSRLLWKLEPNGPVHTILIYCLQNLDFSPLYWKIAPFSEASNTIQQIVDLLISKGFWKQPRIYFSSSISFSERDNYTNIAQKLGGEISNKFNAEVTHVVSKTSSEVKSSYQSIVLAKSNGYVILHNCFKPNVEDLYIQEHSSYGQPEQRKELPYYVSVRWIQDCNTFNEWMYEDDYSLHTSVVEELQNDFEEEEYLDVSGDEDGSKTNDNDQDYVFDLENNSERDSPAGPNSVVDQDEIDSLIGDAPPLIASILDGPEVWPTVTSVNLDRRLPLKFKRHEFEPLVNGVIGNLSNEYDKWTSEAESAEDTTTDIKLTHEQDTFLLQYGFHAKEEFLHLAKIVMPLYSKDPFRHIKFADLRVYAPNIDGLLLYVIYQLLIHMKLINFEPPYSSDEVYKALTGKVELDAVQYGVLYEACPEVIISPLRCVRCKKDCLVGHYHLIANEDYKVCFHCFETGNFPFEYTSKHFQLRYGCSLGISSYSLAEDFSEWNDTDVYKLLLSLEEIGDDWEQISIRLEKPKHECIQKFAQLGTSLLERSVKDVPSMLNEIIGSAENPLMSLINILTNCVHPGLGAEAAKVGLQLLTTRLNLSAKELQEMNLDVTINAFQKVLDKAKQLSQQSQLEIEVSIKELVQSQLNRIQLKIEVWKDMQNSVRLVSQEERTLILRMYEDSKGLLKI